MIQINPCLFKLLLMIVFITEIETSPGHWFVQDYLELTLRFRQALISGPCLYLLSSSVLAGLALTLSPGSISRPSTVRFT